MQSAKKGTSGVLFACVFLPLATSLFAIFSTQVASETQNQVIAGMPQFLWLWLALAFLMMLVIIFSAIKLSFNDHGNLDSNQTKSAKNSATLASTAFINSNTQKEVNNG